MNIFQRAKTIYFSLKFKKNVSIICLEFSKINFWMNLAEFKSKLYLIVFENL